MALSVGMLRAIIVVSELKVKGRVMRLGSFIAYHGFELGPADGALSGDLL
jgi:hypothetical protein